ncbi:HNH endonuclease family protein [Gordonia sp. (in: high G+C Gram-positive bacteria)]|uniref:HNH endonuclease family protein n=1 Tax=Gordonia sp. (in: high G+C Gram-positive bacteria) TaxID=84139 RepID=UPI0039E3CD12
MIHRFRFLVLALAGLLVGTLSGCGVKDFLTEQLQSVAQSGVPSTVSIGQGGIYVDTAGLAKVARLPVKYRSSIQGYTRDAYGPQWDDNVDVPLGHNGCNTRDDILHRDMTNVEMRWGGCFVSTGTLYDQYTGQTIHFVRGPDTSGTVEIDHVVSLANAWTTGAKYWDYPKRHNFANDPMNLQAVGHDINQVKGPYDAQGFLPPNRAYRCTYVNRQLDVKIAYGLWITKQEADAMRSVLMACVKPA